jgi:RNA polymerase-binding transcription factor DksA
MSIDLCLHHPPVISAPPRSNRAITPRERRATSATIASSVTTWVGFVLQLLAVVALQFGDDIFRGNIYPPNVAEAMRHAQQVAAVEQAHGLFVEPALQLWARQVHAPFGFPLYGTIMAATTVLYALGQTVVPLLVAIWLFRRHRSHFPLVRNIVGLSITLAVITYELYPLAPPRLARGLMDGSHAFSFQNTMQGVIGNGKLSSVPLGYNAYSAMPSLHIATALIVSGSVLLLARDLPIRLLAAVYPFLMLFTVLVDANHYVLDAVGGVVVVLLATLMALVIEPGHAHLRRMRLARRTGIPITHSLASTTHLSHGTDVVSAFQKGSHMNSPLTAALDASMARTTLHDLRIDLLQRRERMDRTTREAELDPDGIAEPSAERDQAVTAMMARELDAIDAALQRIADGTYFQCADCGQIIPIRRLQVQPTASLCVACQSRAELRAPQRGRQSHAA